jgi:hypothetical protein
MTTDPSSNGPSLDSEAAQVASSFFAQQVTPELCKSFIDHMTQHGELIAKNHTSRAAGSRVRNNYIRWAHWMELAMSSQGLLVESPVEPPDEILQSIIPTDPIEARAHMRKRANSKVKVETPPAPTESVKAEPDLDLGDIFESLDKEKEARCAEKNLLIELCDTAEVLCTKLIENGKILGVSELRQLPIVITHNGLRGVLVQSFTVVRQGIHYKGDFKVNGHPVTRYNPDMIIQKNGEKLIRSNRDDKQNWVKGRHELFVKGMTYRDGDVYCSYVSMDGNEDGELTNYYQMQDGHVVKVDAERYRKVETLLASGREPAESFRKSAM